MTNETDRYGSVVSHSDYFDHGPIAALAREMKLKAKFPAKASSPEEAEFRHKCGEVAELLEELVDGA